MVYVLTMLVPVSERVALGVIRSSRIPTPKKENMP
jgi:hypothetical protein